MANGQIDLAASIPRDSFKPALMPSNTLLSFVGLWAPFLALAFFFIFQIFSIRNFRIVVKYSFIQ